MLECRQETENTRDRRRAEGDVSETDGLNKGKRNLERSTEKEKIVLSLSSASSHGVALSALSDSQTANGRFWP